MTRPQERAGKPGAVLRRSNMFIALVLPVHRTPYGVQCVETLVYKHCAPLERARKTDRSACAKQTGSRVQKPTGPRTQNRQT